MKFHSFKNAFKRERSRATLGLEIRPDGIAWALSAEAADVGSGFDECTPAQREKCLKTRVQEITPGNCHVRVVLPIDQYQVFQIERPSVEVSELAAAVRWKIKDLVDFPVDDAVVDVFDFPANASRGRGALVNVVVARKSLISDIATLLQASDLQLAEVDVAELAMRNLISDVGQGRSAALVYLRKQYGHMVVCQGTTLYLSRRVDVRADDLRDAAIQEQAVMGLGLELQRSFDYYESQLGQVPPRQIHVIGHDEHLPLGGLLAGSLAAEVLPFSISREQEASSPDPRSLYAVGAARLPAENEA